MLAQRPDGKHRRMARDRAHANTTQAGRIRTPNPYPAAWATRWQPCLPGGVPFVLLVLFGALSCVGINTNGQGQDASTAPSASAATGIACSTDTPTGAKLCGATTACPSLSVDTRSFPNCGFYTLQAPFEIDCVCFGNYLCPVGTASTCQNVSTLFANTTLTDVCNGVSTGNCKQATGSSTAGTGGRTSTCDQACYQSCVGSPACIVACGC